LGVWKHLFGYAVGDDIVGLLGVVSSCMSMYEIWPEGPPAPARSLSLRKKSSTTDHHDDNDNDNYGNVDKRSGDETSNDIDSSGSKEDHITVLKSIPN
jgi:hypothetical protein